MRRTGRGKRRLVGQPILAAAGFQPAWTRCKARPQAGLPAPRCLNLLTCPRGPHEISQRAADATRSRASTLSVASAQYHEFPAGAAIPALARCWGRCLVLASVTGRALNDPLWGKRVRVKFQVEESGKLTGNP